MPAVAVAGAEELLGTSISRSESKSGAVLERRRSERIDSVIDDPEVNREVTRRAGARTGMWVPLIARDQVIGVLEIHDKEGPDARFSDDDLRLAETFAARALRRSLWGASRMTWSPVYACTVVISP